MINKNELLFVVDENNKPLDPKPRHMVHREGNWHRVSVVWVINSKGQILAHRRSMLKDSGAGKWQICFGGHLNHEDSYQSGAHKELKEETGLDIPDYKLDLYKIHRSEKNVYFPDKEFQAIYYTFWDGDVANLVLEEEEVDIVEWYFLEDLKKLFSEKDTNWVEPEIFEEFVMFMENSANFRHLQTVLK